MRDYLPPPSLCKPLKKIILETLTFLKLFFDPNKPQLRDVRD
ncbi:hypothetical protein N9L68_00755 [bacterium]|nr:hypothetical protein [bacterium]